MKRSLTSLAAALFGLAIVSPAEGLDFQTLQEFRNVATAREHEGKWLQTNWLKNMEQAKARARAENKPILVFLVIGFHGEANASDC